MINREFIRFILVGILNTIFGYSIYAFFIFLGFDYKIAALLGTIIGVVFNFQTIGRIVFKNYNNKFFFKFILVYVVTYILSITVIYGLKVIGFNDYIAGGIALIPSAIISFLMNKYFVYKGKNEKN